MQQLHMSTCVSNPPPLHPDNQDPSHPPDFPYRRDDSQVHQNHQDVANRFDRALYRYLRSFHHDNYCKH